MEGKGGKPPPPPPPSPFTVKAAACPSHVAPKSGVQGERFHDGAQNGACMASGDSDRLECSPLVVFSFSFFFCSVRQQ